MLSVLNVMAVVLVSKQHQQSIILWGTLLKLRKTGTNLSDVLHAEKFSEVEDLLV